jgi:hypothetical protein
LAAGSTIVAVGATSALNATSPIASSAMTQFAKPRAGGPVWSNYGIFNGPSSSYNSYADGKNIIIGNNTNGVPTNSVAFLVQTFNYSPSSFAASTPGNLSSVAFSIGTPFSGTTSILAGSNYAPSNSFNDSSQSITNVNTASGSSISKLTSTYYTSGHSVTLTDTLLGDANGDGIVTGADLQIVLVDFGKADPLWSEGNFTGASTIGGADLQDVLVNFNKSVGPLPSVVTADAALLADPQAVSLLESYGITPVAAVPEPASVLLATAAIGGGLLRRRRRA